MDDEYVGTPPESHVALCSSRHSANTPLGTFFSIHCVVESTMPTKVQEEDNANNAQPDSFCIHNGTGRTTRCGNCLFATHLARRRGRYGSSSCVKKHFGPPPANHDDCSNGNRPLPRPVATIYCRRQGLGIDCQLGPSWIDIPQYGRGTNNAVSSQNPNPSSNRTRY